MNETTASETPIALRLLTTPKLEMQMTTPFYSALLLYIRICHTEVSLHYYTMLYTRPIAIASLFLLLRLPLKNNLLLIKQLRQITVLMHRDQNIRSTNKLLRDVELRNRRPVGVLLDTLTQLRIFEDVEGGELIGVDALQAEDLDGGARKAALRCLGGSLHEENDGRGGHGLVDRGAGLVGEQTGLEGCEEGDWCAEERSC